MLEKSLHGHIDQSALDRKNDYLYRVSVKGLIMNDHGEVLVVKEAGRDWWDLPGGGMDHGEDIKGAIAREMAEEVSLEGEFTYEIIDVDEPMHLPNANVLQIRLIFLVTPAQTEFYPGPDADEVSFMNPIEFHESVNSSEQKVYIYAKKAAMLGRKASV